MAFDVSKAALPALWKSDPGFVQLAKYLYGDDVTLERVQKDLFGKMDPSPSDVHATQPAKARKKKPMVVDERALQSVGKAFTDLVSKAYSAGLIDNEGNLNEAEIEKSRTYIRDHAGRFAATTGKTATHLAAAGVLAGTGAALATKAPAAGRYAGESLAFVGRHLKSNDPVERHVARALLPHALKSAGKATLIAGGGASASAGAVYEGTKTYEHMRDPFKKDWSEWDAEREKGSHPERRVARGRRQVNRGTDRMATGVLTGLGSAAGASVLHDAAQIEGARHTANYGIAQHNLRVGNVAARQGEYDHAKEALKEGKKAFDGGLKAGRNARNLARASRGLGYGGVAAGTALVTAGAIEAHRGTTNVKRGTVTQRTRAANPGLAHKYDKVSAEIEALRGTKDDKVVASKSVTWEGDISKVDNDKRQIFGWASVAELDGEPVVDLQGDYIHPDDVEKAAYDYVLKSRVGGDMHARVDEHGNLIAKVDQPHHVSDLIESMVFTPEKCEAMGISKSLAGRWWTGFQVNDPDVWSDIKTGKRTGFSIHGSGLRKSIDIDELDPESELIGKAYQESETVEELIDNLNTLSEVTNSGTFSDLAKHLNHGLQTPQPMQNSHSNMMWGTGIGGAVGANTGTLAGLVSGKHNAEKFGGAAGGLAGSTVGAIVGHHKDKHPPRPPSVEAVLGPRQPDPFAKSVSAANRMGGSPGVRQSMYTQQALQQATETLAPQVAQHIQQMQQQQWQQQQMEQQQMANQAGQQPQQFAVQMGPYANHQNGNSGSTSLTPSQMTPNQSMMPSGPTTSNTQNSTSSRQAF